MEKGFVEKMSFKPGVEEKRSNRCDSDDERNGVCVIR